MGKARILIVFGLPILALLVLFSVFVVDERQKAIRFRLGEIVASDYEPGLHFKVPIINNVRMFDARILTLDAEPERFLTSEKKNVIVDSFVKWRIGDVARYYTAVAGDPFQASQRLDQIIKDGLRSEFSKRTVNEVVSGDRGQIMDTITVEANRAGQQLGIEVVDVRIKRIDLPPEVSNSVYQRMEAERARVARDFRSRGAEAAERIRADADRQRTILLAEAERDGEQIRGEGDAQSAETYANAFGQNKDFFTFHRSINAYQTVFGENNNLLVLDPES